MFERFTEKARRSIFFARYETSGFGSPYIEAEHLLLGLLRVDKELTKRFLPSQAAIQSIRRQIEAHASLREKVSTSVDLPLSHECKRALSYGAEEAARLNHQHIGTLHLLLGILREEKTFAAELLREQGLTLDSIREDARKSETPPGQLGSAFIAGVGQWLAEREASGGIRTVTQARVANSTTSFAIYADDPPTENERGYDEDPAGKLAEIQKRIDAVVEAMEHAIANHQFEKARFYSEEENKERENLRLLREQFNWEEPPSRVPLLCLEIIRDDRFSDVQKRCNDYIAEGVAQVWILDPNSKRAYTATRSEGLRECKGDILRIDNPPLEMDLKKIFA